eukprot:s359_g2.t2
MWPLPLQGPPAAWPWMDGKEPELPLDYSPRAAAAGAGYSPTSSMPYFGMTPSTLPSTDLAAQTLSHQAAKTTPGNARCSDRVYTECKCLTLQGIFGSRLCLHGARMFSCRLCECGEVCMARGFLCSSSHSPLPAGWAARCHDSRGRAASMSAALPPLMSSEDGCKVSSWMVGSAHGPRDPWQPGSFASWRVPPRAPRCSIVPLQDSPEVALFLIVLKTSQAARPSEAAGSVVEQALQLDLATGELASSLVILRHVEAFQEFFVFDAYVKAWDRGLAAPKGTRSGVSLPRAEALSERTQELLKRSHEKVRLVTFHPGFSRWLEPPAGYCNGSQVFLDLMQKRVHVDPHFAGEPATIFRPGPKEVEVGPRQVCARLHGGSGICAWDLEDVVPEEDFVPLPDNDMHRTPFPVVHLIRKVDLSADSIIVEANELRRLNADRFRLLRKTLLEAPQLQQWVQGVSTRIQKLERSRGQISKDLADMLAETKQLQKLAGCEEATGSVSFDLEDPEPGVSRRGSRCKTVPAQTLPLVPEGQPLVSKSRTERLMAPPGLSLPLPESLSVKAKEIDGKSASRVEWRIDSIKTKFKDCLGRPLVSPQFEAGGLPELRLMVFPNLGDLDGLTMREQKARYEARFAEGPVSGAIKFKVVTETGSRLEIKFNLFIGDVVQGPLVHNFADHVIAGFEFSNNWLDSVAVGSLLVGVEVIEINGVGAEEAAEAARMAPGAGD